MSRETRGKELERINDYGSLYGLKVCPYCDGRGHRCASCDSPATPGHRHRDGSPAEVKPCEHCGGTGMAKGLRAAGKKGRKV